MTTPKKIAREVKPGVTATQVALTVAVTVAVTIALKLYIKSDASPFPSEWADWA
jgi:hypothetical protein